ncbi:MAG: hypothetical protein PHN56_03595, partial [Candidatus Nanoarchaeia archaeon]|nr:hypothetical protein [Candidatus Nanoarchaeia archaeon]
MIQSVKVILKDSSFLKKMESNDKEYLKQNHAITVKDDYEIKVIEMIKLLGNLDIITDKPESIKLLVEFSKEMIDKKRIELFKEIYTNELQILTKLKDKKLINAAIVFENPSNKIDEILKYETLDDKDFKLINLKTKTAEFKNEMEKLSDISNNINIGINKVYSDAKTKLSEIKEAYLETIKLKEFLIKDSTEEKKKEAIKKIKDLAKKVNEFSKSMFEKYDEKENDYKHDVCIFANEIRKTRYFFMLSQMLDKLKDKELIIIPNNIKKKNDNIKNLIKIYD